MTGSVPFPTPKPGDRQTPPHDDTAEQPPRPESEREQARKPSPASAGQDTAVTQTPTPRKDERKDRLIKPETQD